MLNSAAPDPGTNEAIALGCTCPVLDNGRGRGYLGQAGIFVYTQNCPVHQAVIPCEPKKKQTSDAIVNRSADAAEH